MQEAKFEIVNSAFKCDLCDRHVFATKMVTFGNPSPESRIDFCDVCWALLQRGIGGCECSRSLLNSMLTPAKRQSLGIHN
jgi:hypothetical protein